MGKVTTPQKPTDDESIKMNKSTRDELLQAGAIIPGKPDDSHKKTDNLYVKGESLTSRVSDDESKQNAPSSLHSEKDVKETDDDLREQLKHIIWETAGPSSDKLDKLEKLFATRTAQLKERVLAELPEKRIIGDYNDGGDYAYRNRRDAVDGAYNQAVQDSRAAIEEVFKEEL